MIEGKAVERAPVEHFEYNTKSLLQFCRQTAFIENESYIEAGLRKEAFLV